MQPKGFKAAQCKNGHDTTSADSRYSDGSCKICVKDKYVPHPKQSPTHCKRGHERTPENLRKGGLCKLCEKIMAQLRKCPHGKQKSQCKECGGVGVCEHGIVRNLCKVCGGASFCEHGKIKAQCRECDGSSFCGHGRRKRDCKECGGVGICEHGLVKHSCKICCKHRLCPHGKWEHECIDCKGAGICRHDKRRGNCSVCNPKSVYKNYVRQEIRRYGALPEGFMTFEYYCELVTQNCWACNHTPEEVNGMGIDRIDNTKGHTSDNVEPSCYPCNLMRMDLTREVFIERCKAITENQKVKTQ